MKKPGKLEVRLAALRALAAGAAGAAGELDVVRDALRAREGIVIAAAARRVAERRLDALAGELAPAFVRLCGDGAAKCDPGCRGKLAVAMALLALERWEPDVFVAGLSIEQLEGWGEPRDDTAAPLRGVCGIAHAQLARPDALDVLADLLADRQAATRAAAAQGLGDAGRRDATALLRYKLRVGDVEPDVLARCVDSLLALAPLADARPFLVDLLAAHDPRAEVAALALGGARDDGSLAALVAWANAAPVEVRRRVGYVAIALVRSDPAIAYLTGVIGDGHADDALAAGKALATFRDVPDVAARLRAAAARRPARDATRREIEQLLA